MQRQERRSRRKRNIACRHRLNIAVRKKDEAINNLRTARVPSREQIYDTWIKARFENSKHDTKPEHVRPLLDKAETLDRISCGQFVAGGRNLQFPSRPTRGRWTLGTFEGPICDSKGSRQVGTRRRWERRPRLRLTTTQHQKTKSSPRQETYISKAHIQREILCHTNNKKLGRIQSDNPWIVYEYRERLPCNRGIS